MLRVNTRLAKNPCFLDMWSNRIEEKEKKKGVSSSYCSVSIRFTKLTFPLNLHGATPDERGENHINNNKNLNPPIWERIRKEKYPQGK